MVISKISRIPSLPSSFSLSFASFKSPLIVVDFLDREQEALARYQSYFGGVVCKSVITVIETSRNVDFKQPDLILLEGNHSNNKKSEKPLTCPFV